MEINQQVYNEKEKRIIQYSKTFFIANANLGCIRQDLMTWLAADLAATTQTFKFIVGHEPA